jgi:hypothetical protein
MARMSASINPDTARLFKRTAYFRHRRITMWLVMDDGIARAKKDADRLWRNRCLFQEWDRVDRGRCDREALDLLRLKHIYDIMAPRLDTRLKDELARELTAGFLQSLSSNHPRFERAISKAKELRAKRQPGTVTEEGDLHVDLLAFGIGCVLSGQKNVGTTEALIAQFAAGWKGDKKNFQALLDQCCVPWTRGKPGRPSLRSDPVPSTRRKRNTLSPRFDEKGIF